MPIPDETRDRWDSRAELDSGKGAIVVCHEHGTTC